MIPIFSSQKYLTNMQIRRSYDKKLTNDYESPKVTCGWNSLSEFRPLYSLKSNPPILHQISSQESKLFYKPKRLAKKIHFKKMKKRTFYLEFELFFSIVPMLIRKLPLGIKNQYIVLLNKRMQFGLICHAYRTQSFQH